MPQFTSQRTHAGSGGAVADYSPSSSFYWANIERVCHLRKNRYQNESCTAFTTQRSASTEHPVGSGRAVMSRLATATSPRRCSLVEGPRGRICIAGLTNISLAQSQRATTLTTCAGTSVVVIRRILKQSPVLKTCDGLMGSAPAMPLRLSAIADIHSTSPTRLFIPPAVGAVVPVQMREPESLMRGITSRAYELGAGRYLNQNRRRYAALH